MPEIDLDFGSVGKVPEGWFRLTCDKAVLKPNKAKDGYIINLQMHYTDMPSSIMPDSDTSYEEFEGNMVYDNVSMKPAARWKLQKVLSAFTGENWEDDGMKLKVECVEDCGEDNCRHDKNIPSLEEATVVALTYSEEYDGRTLARVSRYVEDDGAVEFGPNYTE